MRGILWCGGACAVGARSVPGTAVAHVQLPRRRACTCHNGSIAVCRRYAERRHAGYTTHRSITGPGASGQHQAEPMLFRPMYLRRNDSFGAADVLICTVQLQEPPWSPWNGHGHTTCSTRWPQLAPSVPHICSDVHPVGVRVPACGRRSSLQRTCRPKLHKLRVSAAARCRCNSSTIVALLLK